MANLDRLTSFVLQRMRGKIRDRRIVFPHIPKTAGSSIGRAVADSFGLSLKLLPDGIVHIDGVASHRAATAAREDTVAFRERITRYYMARKDTRHIGGHIPFSRIGYELSTGEWDFVTVFRDPVKRWFSAYFYERYAQSVHVRIDESLESFLESDRGQRAGNHYVSLLTGKNHQRNEIADSDISKAIENLHLFAVIGILEQLNVFVDQFKKEYGVRLRIPLRNASPLSSSERKKQITPEIADKVQRLCEPDLLVYAAAKELVNGRVHSV